MRLILSIFPGIDLLGRAFELEGFCVVRGPDILWGGDIRHFHPPSNIFTGIIGGPPCQIFSRLRFVNPHCGKKQGHLIPEFERVVGEAKPLWFLMENVELAPIPRPEGYLIDSFILNNRWVGGIQWRKRRFTFGSKFETKLQIEVVALEAPFWHHGILGDARPIPVKLLKGGKVKQYTVRAGHDSYLSHRSSAGKSMDIKEMCELQGLPVNFCDEMPFTMHGKRQIIGNAVPIPLGRALAKAISKATL